MKRTIAVLALFAAALGWAQSATAAVVDVGTTYGVYLEGSISGDVFFANPAFDGIAEAGPRGNQVVTISESEASLSASSSRIDVFINATGDLFPDADDVAYIGIGVLDPFNLAYAVSLDDVRVTLRNIANQVIFASGNLAFLAGQGSPWDGSFVALQETLGIEDIGAMGVNSIEFNFFVTDISGGSSIPEPGSVLLCGLALLALSLLQRRRR